MSIKDTIRRTVLTSNVPLLFNKYQPEQFADRQHEYFADSTLWFYNEYAQYSSNYVEAQIQGLNPEEPFEYTTVHIRIAEVVNPSAAITSQLDNYKNILIAEKEYGYLRRGAKVITMGSTWLVINPQNISGGDGRGLIQKCDALWHYLDFYGNVCTEPMAIGDDALRANDPDAQRSTMVAKGYFTAKMQYNDVAKKLLANNTRMVLGSGSYRLSGHMDFIQEFTSVEDSVNLLKFTMRYEAPIQPIDDEVNHIANGKTFKWEILIDGKSTMKSGNTFKFTAVSRRTSENSSEVVEYGGSAYDTSNGEYTTEPNDHIYLTEEHPVSYIWSSSNTDVVTVDSDGLVTAIAEGEASIIATLEQNTSIQASFDLSVTGTSSEPHIEFNSILPESIRAYEEMIVAATYYENGEDTQEVLAWTLSGVDKSLYTYSIEKVYETLDGSYTTDPDEHEYLTSAARNGVVVKCWGGSVDKLIITASYGDVSASTSVGLVGI